MSLQFKPTERAKRPAIQIVVWRYDEGKGRTMPKAVKNGVVMLDGEILRSHVTPPTDLVQRVREAGGTEVETTALDAWWKDQHAVQRRRAAEHANTMVGWYAGQAAKSLADAEAANVCDHVQLTAALAEVEKLAKALKKAIKGCAPKPVAPAQSDAETGVEDGPVDPLREAPADTV